METVSSRKLCLEPNVLYGDYNGWWDFLSNVYYSVDSKSIVSQHPESMIEELDSFYCPSCREFFVEGEAQAQKNRCSKCLGCPVCSCVLEVMALSSFPSMASSEIEGAGNDQKQGDLPPPPPVQYGYSCPHCRWLSDSVGLVSQDPAALSSFLMDHERQSASKSKFQGLIAMFQQEAEEAHSQPQLKRHSSLSTMAPSPVSRGGPGRPVRRKSLTLTDGRGRRKSLTGMAYAIPEPREKTTRKGQGPWKMEDIEQKLKEKEKNMIITDVKEASPLFLDLRGKYTPEDPQHRDEAPAPEVLKSALNLHAISTLEERTTVPACQQLEVRKLLPHRITLRTKHSRRCRKDAEEGKPGILIKPSVNPMEGDTSLPSNRGKWWKKDASAIHFVPHVTIVSLPEIQMLGQGLPSPLILKITNPTSSPVEVCLCQGDFSDETFSGHLPLRTAFTVCTFPATATAEPGPDIPKDGENESELGTEEEEVKWQFDAAVGPAVDEYLAGDEEATELPESLKRGDAEKTGEGSPVVLLQGADTVWIQLNCFLGESYTTTRIHEQDTQALAQPWLVVPILMKTHISSSKATENASTTKGKKDNGGSPEEGNGDKDAFVSTIPKTSIVTIPIMIAFPVL